LVANAFTLLQKMKAKKEEFELQRDCKCKSSKIHKMVQQLKTLELQVQDIHEQHVKNTQVRQVPILYTFRQWFFFLSPCLFQYILFTVILLSFTIFFVFVFFLFVLSCLRIFNHPTT
jgi:Flp pilus assembly protein TadB